MESFKYFCSHGDTACCSYRQLFVKIPLVVSSISGLYSVVCGSACSCFDMISILHDSRKLVPKKKKRTVKSSVVVNLSKDQRREMVVRQHHPECDLPIYKLNIIICECIIPINFYTCVVHTCDGSTLWHISSCHLISRKVINVISFNSLALLSSIFFAPTIASHLASSSVVQLELAGSSYTEFPFQPVYLIAHVDSFSLNKPSLLSSIIKHTDTESKRCWDRFSQSVLWGLPLFLFSNSINRYIILAFPISPHS